MKGKTHMIIWTDAGKAFDKNPTFFNDKKLNKQGKKGTLCNLIEGIYENPRTEIHLTPKNFPLRSGPIQAASHTQLLSIIPNVLAREIRQEIE